MRLLIDIEIPDEMRLLSLQGKSDGTWTACVKANEPFYINSPSGLASADSIEAAILAAIVACKQSMEQYQNESLRIAERVGPSNGSTRHGPQKLSDIF